MFEILVRIRKGTLVFASGTLVSRISGFFRDVLTAALLGATKELAFFFIAFRFANVFRRLLAETPLASSVVPFAEKYEDKQKLFIQLTKNLLCAATFFVMICSISFFWLAQFFSSDWKAILHLTIIMLPSLIFLVGTGINNAFLQVMRCMFPMSVSSTLCNVLWIGSLFFAAFSHTPATVLSWGVVLGFIMQYLFTLYWVFRVYQWPLWKKVYAPFSEMKPLVKPFVLSLVGIAATQINNALDPLFAKSAASEAPAYLWYAIRIYLLPLSLVGVAFFSASFPELSKLYAEKRYKEFSMVTSKGVAYLLLFFIPLSILLMYCAEDIITLIYYHGAFSLHDVVETAGCLSAYVWGLSASAVVLFLSNSYYAQGNYRWPALAAGISVLLNICLNTLFVYYFRLGAQSVAFATALSNICNMLLVFQREYYRFFSLPLLASIAALVCTMYIPHAEQGSQIGAFLHGALSLLLFGGIYMMLVYFRKNTGKTVI